MIASELYLGLMSGTSVDGIDAAIIEHNERHPAKVIASASFPYPEQWRAFALALGQGQINVNLDQLGSFDVALGHVFADSALALLQKAGLKATDIRAIGSHGQTVRHRVNQACPFTMQLGCPHVLAERSGCTVVADFRRRDVAAGGQGAPLVPAFHAALFGQTQQRTAVLNLGGIANVSILSSDGALGFDTGPANALLDAHAQSLGLLRDEQGKLASEGRFDRAQLQQLLSDPYFVQAAPKSTGREYFNLAWVHATAPNFASLSASDRQATLAQLSAQSVAQALAGFEIEQLWVCGGGVHNLDVLHRLAKSMPKTKICSTAEASIDPDYVEAAAFAWLAAQTLQRKPGNLSAVTGASGPRVLGCVIPGPLGF